MPTPYVGAGFDAYIGTRSKPGQTAVEFYNSQNPQQLAFGNPGELANFAKTISGRNDINEQNVFDIVKQGFTPRAEAISKITDDLNATQGQMFDQAQAAPKRQASSLQDGIAQENSVLNSALDEFNTLKTKLSSLTAPNYQQSYEDARAKAGIPELEGQFTDIRKQRRELPYVERANTGNAGVATESQLREQTAEKDIPLYIQEANLIDRLQLASDFVNNAVKMKELDANSARQGLLDAISLVGQTIEMSRTRLNDLQGLEEKEQSRRDAALEFSYKNRISTPFFTSGGTVYRTSDLRPARNKQEYIAMGGKGDFSDAPEIDINRHQAGGEEQSLVLKLATQYPDAGIALSDSLAAAQSKLSGSRLYQDAVRGPQGPTASVSERLLLQQSNIMSNATNRLDDERTSSSDGYANPNTYRNAKREFIAAGGTPTDFFQSFPIEVYISPANRKGDLAQEEKKQTTGLDPAVAAFLGISQ